MGRYFRNMETNKLEIYLEKEDYSTLDPSIRDEIRRHFLFSRKKKAWISRAKFPNLYFAEQIAKKIGLEYEGKVGERLTFAEQQEVKADRAESRARYYDHKAQKAMDEAEKLQKGIMQLLRSQSITLPAEELLQTGETASSPHMTKESKSSASRSIMQIVQTAPGKLRKIRQIAQRDFANAES